MLDEWIIRIVGRLERNYRRGIYPWMVQSRLPRYRAEQTLRRDMSRLARQGRLVRVGGGNSRMGYRVNSSPNGRDIPRSYDTREWEEAVSLDARYAALRERLLGDGGSRAVNERYEALKRRVNPSPDPSPLRGEGLRMASMGVD